jgi:hypothetical protein
MGTSANNLSGIRTDAEFQRHLLLQELSRLLRKIGAAAKTTAPVIEHDTGFFCCMECTDGPIEEDASYFVGSPIYCHYCGDKLGYQMTADHGKLIIKWLASLIRRDIRLPHPNWADLRMAADLIPGDDPIWGTVEYIIYAGSSIDPELRS